MVLRHIMTALTMWKKYMDIFFYYFELNPPPPSQKPCTKKQLDWHILVVMNLVGN